MGAEGTPSAPFSLRLDHFRRIAAAARAAVMKSLPFAIAAGLSLIASPAIAQQLPQKLTIERVFASPSLTGPSPRALKLSPDGKLVTLLRNRPDESERYDLWAIDTATGASRMLVDSKKLGSGAALSEAERMQRERARIGAL